MPSLLGKGRQRALREATTYNLLVLMMKDNVITIDWGDEVLAKTVLTHAGELKTGAAKPDGPPGGASKDAAPKAAAKAA